MLQFQPRSGRAGMSTRPPPQPHIILTLAIAARMGRRFRHSFIGRERPGVFGTFPAKWR